MGFLDKDGLVTLWECIVGRIGTALSTVKSFSTITTKSGSTVTTVEAPNQAAGFTIEAGDNITLVTNAATNTIKIIGADAPEAPEASLEALGISATPTEINHLAGASSNIQNQLNAKVPTTRKVNGKALSSDITLSASDVGAAASSHNHNASDINAGTLNAARLPNISIDKLVAGTTNTTIPSSLLPAYVDDVLEYAAKANFPTTGETGKIYVDKTTNLTWRWSGSAYVEISPSLALGTTSSTAHRGDHGAAAYTHSQSAHAPSNAQKNSDITKAEIEAKLTGKITSHTHDYVANLGDLGITATATELNYVDGVTSDIQTQLNNRWNLATIGTVIAENTDLNDMKTPGTYYSTQANVSGFQNCPTTTGFKMVVMRGYSDGRYHQHVYPGGSTPNYFFRTFNGTSWSDWINLNGTSQYAAAAHYHTSLEVNGTGGKSVTEWAETYGSTNTTGVYPFITSTGTTGLPSNGENWNYCSGTLYARYGNLVLSLYSLSGSMATKTKASNSTEWSDWSISLDSKNYTTYAAPAGYGLGERATYITDLNTSIESGFYYWNSSATNAPFNPANGGGSMISIKRADDYVYQLAFDNTHVNRMAVRSKVANVWQAWEECGPGTFAPASHTHSQYYHIDQNGTAIAKNTNLNDLTTPGNYTCVSSNNSGLTNCPMSSGGFKLVTIRGYSDNYT